MAFLVYVQTSIGLHRTLDSYENSTVASFYAIVENCTDIWGNQMY